MPWTFGLRPGFYERNTAISRHFEPGCRCSLVARSQPRAIVPAFGISHPPARVGFLLGEYKGFDLNECVRSDLDQSRQRDEPNLPDVQLIPGEPGGLLRDGTAIPFLSRFPQRPFCRRR
jgi:hypothetical protein